MSANLDESIGKGKIAFRRKTIGNLAEGAAGKQIKNARQILKLAVKKKWISQKPIDDDFKCSGGEKEVSASPNFGRKN